MTRAELEAAIACVIDAEREAAKAGANPHCTTGDLIVQRRFVQDARADLDGLLGVLDHERAFTPESAIAS